MPIKKQDQATDTARVRTRERLIALPPTQKPVPGEALAGIPKTAMPRDCKPMLAAPINKSFDRPGWIFEIKWDGYRAIAEVTSAKVRLYSRNNLSFERIYTPIVEALKQLEHEAILDGEIVVLDQAGQSQFQLLQNYQNTKQGPLVYYVFDLLYLDGHDLRGLPLLQRKEILAELLPTASNIRLSEHVEERGIAFFDAVAARGLEGIIAKDGASRYHEGRRNKCWLKIKTCLRHEAIICGFTQPRGSRQNFGSLVLGVFEGGKLLHIGNVGSGFTEQSLEAIRARLEPLRQAKPPFHTPPKLDKPADWVRPELVCEVSFADWSDDGHLRHPIFQGLRDDVPAHRVTRGRSQSSETALESDSPAVRLGSTHEDG